MEREQFSARLGLATERALAFAREMVFNPLPDLVRYQVLPNRSFDGHPLVGDEQVFPADDPAAAAEPAAVDAGQAVAALWHGGRVPEWVDINVHAVGRRATVMRLRCCGRYTATDDLLYHRPEGHPPFHVTSPRLPPEYRDGKRRGKFDLLWHLQHPGGID